MIVTPLTGTCGAEISDFSLSSECSKSELAEIRELLLRYGVLVFRNQASLTREQHIAFGSRFGELECSPKGEAADPEVIRLVHNAESPPTENIWHSDMSFRSQPPLGSILRVMKLPPKGGDTVFVDMRVVWEGLPSGIRDLLYFSSALHDIAKHANPDEATRLREACPVTAHPIVRVHPESGDEILFVNQAYTSQISGLSSEDSSTLLQFLFQRVTIPEYQCRVRWAEGTVVFWDNRAMQHYAVGDYMPAERIMERITISGDAPRGPSALSA